MNRFKLQYLEYFTPPSFPQRLIRQWVCFWKEHGIHQNRRLKNNAWPVFITLAPVKMHQGSISHGAATPLGGHHDSSWSSESPGSFLESIHAWLCELKHCSSMFKPQNCCIETPHIKQRVSWSLLWIATGSMKFKEEVLSDDEKWYCEKCKAQNAICFHRNDCQWLGMFCYNIRSRLRHYCTT